jgi:hypothetical protein
MNSASVATKALIYCRVSRSKQASDGHGLDSQEMRCRQHAERSGYEVEAVFPDDVSGGGGFMKRPGMVARGRRQLASLQESLRDIERKIDQLLDRLLKTEGASVITAYERRVRELESQKMLIGDRIASCGKPKVSFDETYRTAVSFLRNPWKLWYSERTEDRRVLLRLVFAERLVYARGAGYRTAKISTPFKLLGEDNKTICADPEWWSRGESSSSLNRRFRIDLIGYFHKAVARLLDGLLDIFSALLDYYREATIRRRAYHHAPRCLAAN